MLHFVFADWFSTPSYKNVNMYNWFARQNAIPSDRHTAFLTACPGGREEQQALSNYQAETYSARITSK